MTAHVDADRLSALRHGLLSGAESRELLNHVAGCVDCQRLARETLDVGAQAREVVRSLSGAEARPGFGRRTLRVAGAIVAAAVLLLALSFLLRPRREPVPSPVVTVTPAKVPGRTIPRPEAPTRPAPLEALVREAVAAGALEMPASLIALQPAGDRFRARGPEAADLPAMRPYGEMVEDSRPQFRWTAVPGATYTVIVGENDRIVAQSPTLKTPAWRPATDLQRGKAYRWQVVVKQGDGETMIPMPPAPPARFHVLDAKTQSRLQEVRRSRPDDALLLGVLYARAGLREAARAQLQSAAERNVTGARALRDSIDRWPLVRR